jgi:hypothetical protein
MQVTRDTIRKRIDARMPCARKDFCKHPQELLDHLVDYLIRISTPPIPREQDIKKAIDNHPPCQECKHTKEAASVAHKILNGINDPTKDEESASGSPFVPNAQKQPAQLFFTERPERIVQIAARDQYYLRVFEADERVSRMPEEAAHRFIMDCRILALFGLNTFTTELNAANSYIPRQLDAAYFFQQYHMKISLRIFQTANILIRLGKMADPSNQETAQLFKETVRRLHCAGVLNEENLSTQTWEKVEAFEGLLEASLIATRESVLAKLRSIIPQAEMSVGERFLLEHLTRTMG